MAYGSVLTDNIQSSTTGTPVVFKDGAGTQIGTLCRAWVNFDGYNSPYTVRASFNVSSVVFVSSGVFNINFTNAMPDANYTPVLGGMADGAITGIFVKGTYLGTPVIKTTTQLQINSYSGGGNVGMAQMYVSVFR